MLGLLFGCRHIVSGLRRFMFRGRGFGLFLGTPKKLNRFFKRLLSDSKLALAQVLGATLLRRQPLLKQGGRPLAGARAGGAFTGFTRLRLQWRDPAAVSFFLKFADLAFNIVYGQR